MQLSSHTTRASWSSTLSVRNLAVSVAVSLLREPLRQSVRKVAVTGVRVSGRSWHASGAAVAVSLRGELTGLMGVRQCESGRVEDIGPSLQHVAPHARAHHGVRQSIISSFCRSVLPEECPWPGLQECSFVGEMS